MTSLTSAYGADRIAWDERTAALARFLDKEKASLKSCRALHAAQAKARAADHHPDELSGRVIWAPWLAGQPPVYGQVGGASIANAPSSPGGFETISPDGSVTFSDTPPSGGG
jgi:hypothetical protein